MNAAPRRITLAYRLQGLTRTMSALHRLVYVILGLEGVFTLPIYSGDISVGEVLETIGPKLRVPVCASELEFWLVRDNTTPDWVNG